MSRVNGRFVAAALAALCLVSFDATPASASRNETSLPVFGAEAEAIQKNSTRQIVDYNSDQTPGTIIIDTADRKLYHIQPGGKAVAYGIGVGRPGFEWSGVQRISRKAEWPGWTPPPAMRKRQPYLPAFMPGGPQNPLGARALYLGSTIYRIHGTNEARTIGQAVSSGCIRMLNDEVIELYENVDVGTKVIVLR